MGRATSEEVDVADGEAVTTFPAQFTLPLRERYLEDYVPGARYAFDATVTVEEDEVLRFGRTFDPQPFHVDRDLAAASRFGGIIASGWHTAALMMSLYAAEYLSPVSSLSSPGVDELRWPAPVRPGDVLRLRTTVLECRRSRSKPDRGVLRTFVELVNQRDELVLSAVLINLMAAREIGGG